MSNVAAILDHQGVNGRKFTPKLGHDGNGALAA
jgi:hypothetical protein